MINSMLDIPISIKVLKCLKENQARELTKGEIADSIKEDQKYVNKALEELVERDIVVKKTEFYSYIPTRHSEEFSEKMFKLYEVVSRKRLEKLLIRGLLCKAPLHMNGLLEILEMEGFDREEIKALLEEDIKNGYIKKIRFPELRHLYRYYPFMRRFFWFFRQRLTVLPDYKKLGEYFKHQGVEVQEEDYLIGSYPPELANPAREYLDREHKELRRKLLFKSLHLHFLSFYSSKPKS